MWAVYAQDIKASCNYGRPPLLRLRDLDLDEPSPVDDVFITAEGGIGVQPDDRTSLMAGFVAAVRLHMVLERTYVLRFACAHDSCLRMNRAQREFSVPPTTFSELAAGPMTYFSTAQDELDLLQRATDGLSGDWSYTSEVVVDPDSVRFFQKTRVFMLRSFVRLLIARHQFSEWLELSSETSSPEPTDVRPILQQIAQCRSPRLISADE